MTQIFTKARRIAWMFKGRKRLRSIQVVVIGGKVYDLKIVSCWWETDHFVALGAWGKMYRYSADRLVSVSGLLYPYDFCGVLDRDTYYNKFIIPNVEDKPSNDKRVFRGLIDVGSLEENPVEEGAS